MAVDMLKWSSFGVIAASLLGVPVEWLKNSLTFHPDRVVHTSPDAYSLPYEEVWFGGTNGHTLHGWYLPGRGASLFIWFHGNAGNVAHRLSHLQLLYERVGGSHFLFDYQGYGKSQGKPTIPGIVADGRDAITVVQARGWATGKRLIYFGESLGCAVVVTLAVEHPPDRVILSAPFYSLRAMGQLVLPPLAFLVDGDLNSARLIGQLRAPLLVIHGTADETVPFQQGQALYAEALQPKVFYAVPGGGHADLHEVGGETYLRVMRDFVLGPALR
ncbi:MAG: alpha/beta hydrolase [Deltaproteobacteria bacterium]|nr:alpha/beta hydrolase [Deltaproteobacteria bacterium]